MCILPAKIFLAGSRNRSIPPCFLCSLGLPLPIHPGVKSNYVDLRVIFQEGDRLRDKVRFGIEIISIHKAIAIPRGVAYQIQAVQAGSFYRVVFSLGIPVHHKEPDMFRILTHICLCHFYSAVGGTIVSDKDFPFRGLFQRQQAFHTFLHIFFLLIIGHKEGNLHFLLLLSKLYNHHVADYLNGAVCRIRGHGLHIWPGGDGFWIYRVRFEPAPGSEKSFPGVIADVF